MTRRPTKPPRGGLVGPDGLPIPELPPPSMPAKALGEVVNAEGERLGWLVSTDQPLLVRLQGTFDNLGQDDGTLSALIPPGNGLKAGDQVAILSFVPVARGGPRRGRWERDRTTVGGEDD